MTSQDFIQENEYFISDLGRSITVDSPGQSAFSGRYAVWRNAAQKQQYQLVEVGSSLSPLQQKYNIPAEWVGRVVV